MTQPGESVPSAHTLEDDLFGTGAESERVDRGPRITWQPTALPSCRDLCLGAAGAATFFLVDAVMMWGPLIRGAGSSTPAQTITLLVLAFGLGGLLAWHVRGSLRPFGFGMMAGWAFSTLISVGYLTGVSP
jgi:hypothetical protein